MNLLEKILGWKKQDNFAIKKDPVKTGLFYFKTLLGNILAHLINKVFG